MRNAMMAFALLALSCGPPAKIMKCSITADGILDVFMKDDKLQFSVPRVLVFDRDGGLVSDSTGYGSHTVWNIRLATHRAAKSNATRLEAFAANLRGEDGRPLDAEKLKGTATIADLGAEWCKPCHALEADLRHLTGVTVLLIDADPVKHGVELQAALKKRLGR